MRKTHFLLALLLISPLLTANADKADTNINKDISEKYDDAIKDFSYLDTKGKEHKFSDHKGKWVLINYWATYCPPCLAEIPDIDRFAQDNKKTFVSLGIDAGGSSPAEIDAFKKRLNVHYPLIPGQESALLAFGMVEAIPTSYIVSPKGVVVKKYVGIITYDDLDYFVHPPIFEK